MLLLHKLNDILIVFPKRYSPSCYLDPNDGDIICDACPIGSYLLTFTYFYLYFNIYYRLRILS